MIARVIDTYFCSCWSSTKKIDEEESIPLGKEADIAGL